MQESMEFTAVFEKAYRVAYHYVGEHHTAEDIAQETSIKLWMRAGVDEIHSVDGWVYQTAKHAAFDILKKQKRWTSMAEMDFMIAPPLYEEGPDLLTRLEEVPDEVVTQRERAFVQRAMTVEGSLHKVAQVLRTRYDVVRNRLYRIRQEIALYQLIQDGVIHTAHPSGTRIHANISNFLKKLHHCLQQDCLDEMSGYFRDATVIQPVPQLNMGTIHHYTLDELQSRHYMINVNYFTPEKQFRACRIEVELGEFGALRVLRFPIMPSLIVKVALADLDADTRALIEEDRRGVPACTEEDAQRIAAEIAGAEKIFEL